MEQGEIEAAAARVGLEELFALFPDEVATAIELAREQADAMRALAFDWDDAP